LGQPEQDLRDLGVTQRDMAPGRRGHRSALWRTGLTGHGVLVHELA
jgi:hypothetical protein